ncbi:hypothetical protein Fleli_1573 [Bernardetia litoralis DSM 6794]|uniref:Uncharacterized protein n=1 Tax=Bernardetia litoralis (strain ATCC 23117 / DSM 6794 / NBRC 15988 / NCIMB 1366 / Fx l1 / Sio-4) TaxID=880071 RepID=I4AJ57_BERLS|nr:hypothetical protein [Bernardetia litoralis]AFM03992.1 hypothetical protein Fleli_1573 [Bernardetia litoralis DSM 6794]
MNNLLYPIKNYLVSRKNRKIRPSTSKHYTLPYKEAKTFGILLLIESSEDAKQISPIIEKLQKDNKKVEVILFQTKKVKEELSVPYRFFLVHPEQMDWNGNMDVVAVQKFISTEFDYLFCISNQHVALFERILLLSQAKCRVGAHIVGKEFLYEWMVFREEQNTIASLAKNMFSSISMLQNASPILT